MADPDSFENTVVDDSDVTHEAEDKDAEDRAGDNVVFDLGAEEGGVCDGCARRKPRHVPARDQRAGRTGTSVPTAVGFVQRFIGSKRAGQPDGIYGPNTEAGVRWYQQMRGIDVDGICGTATFRQMGIKG